jgi:hypothetical protein
MQPAPLPPRRRQRNRSVTRSINRAHFDDRRAPEDGSETSMRGLDRPRPGEAGDFPGVFDGAERSRRTARTVPGAARRPGRRDT